MRSLMVLAVVLVSACAPPETVSKVKLAIASVEVVVTGRCTGTPCDSATLDRYPLKAPSSSFELNVFRNSDGEAIVTTCDQHAVGLGRYKVTRANTDGGTEVVEVWGGALGPATTYEVWTQSGGSSPDFTTSYSLYGLRVDGTQNLEPMDPYPHDLDPVSNDGGVLVFEYKPFRYIDPDGGFVPTVREELPFTFTETHRVSMKEEQVEEHFSQCPRAEPSGPYNPGWY